MMVQRKEILAAMIVVSVLFKKVHEKRKEEKMERRKKGT